MTQFILTNSMAYMASINKVHSLLIHTIIDVAFWHRHGFGTLCFDASNLLNRFGVDIMHLKKYTAQNRSLTLKLELDLYTRWCHVQKEFS